jgi:hypothetical protein
MFSDPRKSAIADYKQRIYFMEVSRTFELVLDLVERKEVMISDHGYDELAEEAILVKDIVASVSKGMVVEDYPRYSKGPCVLVLQKDNQGNPIHVVWGIPKGASSPAVLVTAYRPDPDRWSNDFMRRKR